MAVSYGFYNSLNGDRKYNARHMSMIFDGIIRDGVFMSIGTAFVVEAAGGMILNVGIGRAWFNGTWTHNDAVLPIRLEDSDLLLDRIDAVVLEVDTNDNSRMNSIKIITGVPATEPVRPEMVKESGMYQYPLAYISVTGTTQEITQADITNMVGTSDTPFVTGILETMNIDALVAQWGQQWVEWKQAVEDDNDNWTTSERQEYEDWCANQQKEMSDWIAAYQSELRLIQNGFVDFRNASESDFDIWFELVKGKLSEDAAGNLQNQVNEIVEREFARYYDMVTKVTDVIKNANGRTERIVATAADATATTTFEDTNAGKVITTVIIPTSGNWDYTKVVTITKTETGTHFEETVTKTTKVTTE